MSGSEKTAAKVEIDAAELRQILAAQFRAEVSETVWRRVRNLLTGGGLLSIGLLLGAVAWIDSTIKTTARDAMVAARPELEQELGRAAAQAAAQAVQADIAQVERVRARVTEILPERVGGLLRDNPELAAAIRAQVEQAARAQLSDLGWRRTIERALMAQQARDGSQSYSVRLFALADLANAPDGLDPALAALTESAARLPAAPPGPGGSSDAQFLLAGADIYARALAQPGAAPRREAHEALLERLAELAAPAPAPGSAFEKILHRFGTAPDVAWAARRARAGDAAARPAFLHGLATHPSEEARDRVVALLCGSDEALAKELLGVIAARADDHSLRGDAEGALFLRVAPCVDAALLALRLPAAPADVAGCLSEEGFDALWRGTQAPAMRLPAGAVARPVAGGCAALGQPALLAQLRTPPGWARLGQPSTEALAALPTGGLAALLPDAEGDGATEPPWVRALAEGTGRLGGLAREPERNLGLLALLLGRLVELADGPAVEAARARVAGALAAARPDAERRAERLLLDLLGHPRAASPELCAAVLEEAVRRGLPGSRAPSAQALACLARGGSEPAALRAVVMPLLGAAAALAPDQREGAMWTFGVALGAADREGAGTLARDRGAALVRVLDWLAEQAAAGGAADPVTHGAIEAVLVAGGPALTGPMLRADQGRTTRIAAWRGWAAATPPLDAVLRRAAPWLFDTGFASRVGTDSAAPVAGGGRFWVAVPAGEGLVLEWPLAARLTLIATGDAPRVVSPVEEGGGRLSAELARGGRYLVAAERPEALAQLARAAPAPIVEGLLQPAGEPGAPPAPDRLRSALGPEGMRHFGFDLEAGRHYAFRTLRLERGLDTVIRLEGPGLARAPEDDDGGAEPYASRLCVRAEATGRHWLEVRNFGRPPARPLGFELRVTPVESCE